MTKSNPANVWNQHYRIIHPGYMECLILECKLHLHSSWLKQIRLALKKCWFAVTRPTLLKTCRPKKFYCYATKEIFFCSKKNQTETQTLIFCSFVSCVFILFNLTNVIYNTDCNLNVNKLLISIFRQSALALIISLRVHLLLRVINEKKS